MKSVDGTSVSTELLDEERAFLAEVAEGVVRRRLALPAMMFLEMSTPLNMLGSSALTMASPLWRAVVPVSRIDQLAKLLEKRAAIPALIEAIDEAEADYRERRAAEKREAKAAKQERRRARRAPHTPPDSTPDETSS